MLEEEEEKEAGDAGQNDVEEKIQLTQDQKILVEPWIAVFGRDPIMKLFSKKFSEKEKAIGLCEDALKDPACKKTRETLKVACLVVSRAIQDKVLAVSVKGI